MHEIRSFSSFLRSTCLLALALGSVFSQSNAAPSSATDGGETRGLRILLEAWSLTPRNADLDYAFTDVGSLSGGGELATLTHGRELTPRFYAGWRLGSSKSTQLGMTFWEYDGEASAFTGVDPSNIGPLLAAPVFVTPTPANPIALGLQVDSASAGSRVRATVVDGGARWSHALGERGRLDFDVEVRFFRYERERQVSYRRESGQVRELFINDASDTSGLGPRVGVGYTHAFGGRFAVGGQFGLALPIGEFEGTTRQEFLVDGVFIGAVRGDEPGVRQAFLQIEAEIRIEVRIWNGLSATGAYGFQQWSGVERSLRFVDAPSQATAVAIEEDALFEGALLGIRYAF